MKRFFEFLGIFSQYSYIFYYKYTTLLLHQYVKILIFTYDLIC